MNNSFDSKISCEKSVAIILAAGIGKRLQPLTFDKPKPLIEVGGLPIIIHQLHALESCGVERVIVVLGYKSTLIKDTLLHSGLNIAIDLIDNADYDHTNNLFSLYLASKFINSEKSFCDYNRVILINGDIIFDKEILEDILANNSNQIAVDIGQYNDESMKVVIDNKNRIIQISKKIPATQAFGVSIDLYSFNKKTWCEFSLLISNMLVETSSRNHWTEHALQVFFNQSDYVFVPTDIKKRFWFEIDTIEDLKEAERLFIFFKKTEALINKKLFIFDLDGTLLLGNSILPFASECVSKLLLKNKIVVFLTNNSAYSKHEHLVRLIDLLGIQLNNDNLHTSVFDTIKYLHKQGIQKIFLIATPSVSKEFLTAGFDIDDEQAEAVVVTFDKTLTYNKLQKASYLLEKKNPAIFILTNRDIKCPTENGYIPDAGSIGRMLELTTDHKIDVCRGKPNSEMILDLILEHNLSVHDCVFFGDRLYTDIKMGDESGVMTVLMLTGETKFSDLDLDFISKNIVLKDLNELHDIIS